MRFTTIAIAGLTIGAVIYGGEQLEKLMMEANKPLPSAIHENPQNSQSTTKQKTAEVDVNEVAARERAIRDAREQALQARYRSEAEQAAYQAQAQQQQSIYQAELQAQQAAYQAQQAAYHAQLQAQHAAAQARVSGSAPSAPVANTMNQSSLGSGDATYRMVNGRLVQVPQGR